MSDQSQRIAGRDHDFESFHDNLNAHHGRKDPNLLDQSAVLDLDCTALASRPVKDNCFDDMERNVQTCLQRRVSLALNVRGLN
jgi:hypothetical protein